MDLGLTEEQELLKNFARDFLTNECTEKLVRDMEEDERGYTDDLWNGMANQGWMGLITAEELGGAGLKFLDLCVLLEEFGRALVPGPFINTVLTSGFVEALGTDEQKQQYCTAVAAGQHVMTFALTEPSARFDSSGIKATAEADGEDDVVFDDWLEKHAADVVANERAVFTKRKMALDNRLRVINQQMKENRARAENLKSKIDIFRPLVEQGHEARLTLLDLEGDYDQARLAAERAQKEYDATKSGLALIHI